jgi:hypothetical protein
MSVKEKFLALLRGYFDGVELPITFYHTDHEITAELVSPVSRSSPSDCEIEIPGSLQPPIFRNVEEIKRRLKLYAETTGSVIRPISFPK